MVNRPEGPTQRDYLQRGKIQHRGFENAHHQQLQYLLGAVPSVNMTGKSYADQHPASGELGHRSA